MSLKPVFVFALLFALGSVAARAQAAAESPWVRGTYRSGDFKLVHGARAADIFVAPEDFKVARIAAEELATDIERMTGRKPTLRGETNGLSAHAVLIGTLGKSPLIES